MGGQPGPRLRVLGVPAYRNRTANPYNALLYEAMARSGVAVEEASPRTVLRGGHGVVHVHWPEYLFSGPRLGTAVAKAIVFVATLSLIRARRASVVWTVHNLRGHDHWHARLEARLWRWFVERVDGCIALTPQGLAAARERFPPLERRPGFVIPHGLYRGAYPDGVTAAAARAALGLPPAARVVLFLGTIRPYKNVPALVAAFRRVPGEEWRLLVAGQPASAEVERALRLETVGDGRVRLDLQFVPDDRLQLYLRAADLVALPYREVLNSGSALLALSFERPVLVPDRGAMAELRQAVGAEWVRTYAGEIGAETLIEAMAWAESTPRDGVRPRRDLDWSEIARQTVLAYEAVRATRRPSGTSDRSGVDPAAGARRARGTTGWR